MRSSAIDEDGAQASFAGIYDSVLDVRGDAAVRDAIEQGRASARSPRALAYRHDGQPARMAIVVQRLAARSLRSRRATMSRTSTASAIFTAS